jgi:hypothetical protein
VCSKCAPQHKASVVIDNTSFDALASCRRNPSDRERAFGFLTELKKESLATFNALTSKLNVEGFDAQEWRLEPVAI